MTPNRRFFSDHPVEHDRLRIDGDEYHHLHTVMRARVDDVVEIIDGRGRLMTATLEKLESRQALARVQQTIRVDRPPRRLVIAPALTKNQPMNWMIEKLCELGVDEIRPIVCQRSDIRYSPALLGKWQKLAVQALKVNHRLWLSEIFPATPLETIAIDAHCPTRILLDLETTASRWPKCEFPVLAVIGPPGDFSPDEKTALRERGFQPLKINPGILKTETAAIAVAAILASHD